jgi:hypothetical protein
MNKKKIIGKTVKERKFIWFKSQLTFKYTLFPPTTHQKKRTAIKLSFSLWDIKRIASKYSQKIKQRERYATVQAYKCLKIKNVHYIYKLFIDKQSIIWYNVLKILIWRGFCENRYIRISGDAGFLLVLTGDIMIMPGLPKLPVANYIDILANGEIVGLF